jgi:hypothetical protein
MTQTLKPYFTGMKGMEGIKPKIKERNAFGLNPALLP